VFWAESKGIDVTYWTNNDLDEYGGQLPARARTIFRPGHDEYYSLRMRATLSQAINHGVNVANLGANTAYRLITFTDNSRRATAPSRSHPTRRSHRCASPYPSSNCRPNSLSHCQ
jgi:hypothetical protein